MITLFLYNAHGYVCYAIADDTRILHTTSLYSPKRSTEVYMPHIEHSFSMLGIPPSAIERILCTNGPTSFTATRLIVTTALGIALPRSLPIATISTLHAVALNAPLETTSLWVALQAQKNTFYTQCFHITKLSSSLNVIPLNDIALLTYEDFFTLLATSPNPYIIGDEGFHTLHYTRALPATLLPVHYSLPSAFALYTYSLNAHYSTNPPDTCYIRTTDAEENITEIAQKLGYSLEEIHDIYNKGI